MEKFGVLEDNETLTKIAAKQDQAVPCPVCGAVTKQHGRVFLCPTHGSKPFERDASKK